MSGLKLLSLNRIYNKVWVFKQDLKVYHRETKNSNHKTLVMISLRGLTNITENKNDKPKITIQL